MQTKEYLSIFSLGFLGICFISGLYKAFAKSAKDKNNCDIACSISVYIAVVLIGVSQLLEEEKDTFVGSSTGTIDDGDPCKSDDKKGDASCKSGVCDNCNPYGHKFCCPEGKFTDTTSPIPQRWCKCDLNGKCCNECSTFPGDCKKQDKAASHLNQN